MAKRKQGRLRKGSPEAKRRMAELRAMQGGRSRKRSERPRRLQAAAPAETGGRRPRKRRGRRVVVTPARPARTNTNRGGGEVATTKKRRRRTSARRTVRRTAVRARRVYRRARSTKAGKAIVPVLVNGVMDAGLVVGGRMAGRVAGNLVGARPGTIPGALVCAGAGLAAGLVVEHVLKGDAVRSRMVVAGALSKAVEDLVTNFVPGAADYLGEPYYQLSSGELAGWASGEDDLVRFAGSLAPGADLGAYDYAADTIYDPVIA